MKHTPGPWKASAAVQNNGPNYYVVAPPGWGAPVVAACMDKANARLIAAAPDLLEAVKTCVVLAIQNVRDCQSTEWAAGAQHRLDFILAAIAKAEEG